MITADRPSRKHVPLRRCVVCRTQHPKRDLTRLVYTEAGLQMDPSGKMAGRGAYLCAAPACWQRAASGDVLTKALKVRLNTADRQRLRQAAPQP